jgi:hypothetical protein
MSGSLTRLVPAAQLLAAVAGGADQATVLAVGLVEHGLRALPSVGDDLHEALRLALADAGIADGSGVSVGRAAELVVVCEILAAAPPLPAQPPKEPRIVFSAPADLVGLAPEERLDSLVLDVIRCATTELVIGGAFWNEAGFRLLDDVVLPAVRVRRVRTTLIVHPPVADHQAPLRRWIEELEGAGSVTTYWYVAPSGSMMHAKFVIGDRHRGYLGTANLTSWGMGAHVEAGLELLPGQCRRFLAFLDSLRSSGLLSPLPPPTVSSTID